MAISDSIKTDLLYKKLFGVTKTDTAANKSPSNEAIASPLLLRGDMVWAQASTIPTTAAAVSGVVQAYTSTNKVQTTPDTTTQTSGGIYPTWKTGLTDWISPEFDTVNVSNTYRVKVYYGASGLADPASSGGTQLSPDGSGGVGEWYFDYQSGVLHFIGGIPTGMTGSHVIYVYGYRYVGLKGISGGGYTTTATSSTDLTLTSASTQNQFFTGTVAQNVILPVTSTLTLGSKFYFHNKSTATVTVKSSGSDTVISIAPNMAASVYCTTTSGTSAASWSRVIEGTVNYTGTGGVVLNTSPTITNLNASNILYTSLVYNNGGDANGLYLNGYTEADYGNDYPATKNIYLGVSGPTTDPNHGNIVLSGYGGLDGNYSPRILNVGTPIEGSDAANKEYVDAAVTNMHVHQPANYATVNDLSVGYNQHFVYYNGANNDGEGATLTITNIELDTAVSFTKPNFVSATDTIDTGLAITRSDGGGAIWNPLGEASFVKGTSPAGTLWNTDGWSNLSNYATRTYGTLNSVMVAWNDGFYGNYWGGGMTEPEFIMKDTINNKYYKVKFTWWQQGDGNGNVAYGGGFSYVRQRIVGTLNVSLTKPQTAFDNGAFPSLTSTDRYLVKNQIDPRQNGIYVSLASDTSFKTLVRASDFNNSTDLGGGDFVFVTSGDTYKDTGWVQITDAPTIGTSAIYFNQFSGAGAYTAGNGLTQSGTTFNVGGTANRISVTSDAVDIASTYVGQTSITTLGNVTTGTWNADAVGSTKGGTGFTTYATGDMIYASATNTLSKLTAGADGKILQVNSSGVPVWGDVDGGTY